jgi:hypothetical protein
MDESKFFVDVFKMGFFVKNIARIDLSFLTMEVLLLRFTLPLQMVANGILKERH